MTVLIDDGDMEVWLPESQIEDEHVDGDLVVFTIPEWLALDKGLI